MITVFTPTYNRANNLYDCFESLKKQESKDFEWIIVDDGSVDNTTDVLHEIVNASSAAGFHTRCFRKENGGKHTAINLGVQKAKGELFLILDSDDTLLPQAIQYINEEYDKVKYKADCGGVCGLMGHHNGEQIGNGFPQRELYASSIVLRYQYRVTGDLLEVFKTSVLREYLFPEIPKEHFCPEQLVWFRIAQKYKLHCFNKIIYYRDYLEGGLTDKIVKIRMQSSIASMLTYSEMLDYQIPIDEKIKAAINYWRFRFSAKSQNVINIAWSWYFFAPLGYLYHLYDKYKY